MFVRGLSLFKANRSMDEEEKHPKYCNCKQGRESKIFNQDGCKTKKKARTGKIAEESGPGQQLVSYILMSHEEKNRCMAKRCKRSVCVDLDLRRRPCVRTLVVLVVGQIRQG